MERLTKRLEDGQAVMDCKECPESWNTNPDGKCTALYCRNMLKDRLAAYEDTGLEPEDIISAADMAKITCALHEFNVYKKLDSLDRLRELAQADREGRCVVLPAKIHDKLYYLPRDRNEEIKEIEVESIHSWGGEWQLFTHTDKSSRYYERYDIDFKKVGKTVFLTREEAEAALEARQDDAIANEILRIAESIKKCAEKYAETVQKYAETVQKSAKNIKDSWEEILNTLEELGW